MMSTEMFHNDFQQWPALSSTIDVSTTRPTESAATATNDWEILDDSNNKNSSGPLAIAYTDPNQPPSDFVVIDNYNLIEKASTDSNANKPPATNRKSLRHSVSSPMLVGALNTLLNDEEDADDNFTLLSDVASVWTTASTSKSTMSVSFRDAILLSSPNADHLSSYRSAVLSPGIQQTPKRQRSRIQPKIVVVQSPTRATTITSTSANSKHLRRCSKSTGDLLSVPIIDESDCNNNRAALTSTSDHQCTDRLYHENNDDDVYYDYKAMGAVSHMNGLKLRPDEQKRRDMIMHKKDQQRRQMSNTNKVKSKK